MLIVDFNDIETIEVCTVGYRDNDSDVECIDDKESLRYYDRIGYSLYAVILGIGSVWFADVDSEENAVRIAETLAKSVGVNVVNKLVDK